ncbi:MAG: AEC family transporter [Verrucomicrobiota bacterium]
MKSYSVGAGNTIRLGKEGRGSGQRSFAVSAGVQNFGYAAVPVLGVLFVTEESGDGVLGVLFVHSLGVELALWVFGVVILTASFSQLRKHLLNGPVIGVLLGLLMSYSGLWKWFEPDGNLIGGAIRQAVNWLGVCAFPTALFLVGATLFDLVRRESMDWKVVTGGVLVRNVMMSAVILCAAKSLPVAEELRQVLVVQAAMPAAVTPIILTRLFGGQPQVAVQVVVATSVVSLVSMPLWVALGMAWVF